MHILNFSIITNMLNNISYFLFREKNHFNDDKILLVLFTPNVVNAFQLDLIHFISDKFQVIRITKDYFNDQ